MDVQVGGAGFVRGGTVKLKAGVFAALAATLRAKLRGFQIYGALNAMLSVKLPPTNPFHVTVGDDSKNILGPKHISAFVSVCFIQGPQIESANERASSKPKLLTPSPISLT